MRKKNVIKDNIPVIIVTSIISIIGSLSIGYANDILFAGNEVSYDNSVSGLTSTTVQGALDEMCTVADFSDRVSNLEGYFQNNASSYFNANNLWVGQNGSTSENTNVFLSSGSSVRGVLYYSTAGSVNLAAYDSSGNIGQGTLNLRGNPVQINGTNVTDLASRVSSLERSMVYFTSVQSTQQTINAGSHVDISISIPSGTIPSGKSIYYAFVEYTPNSAWVFGQITSFDSSTVRIGAYNTYSSQLSGKFTVVLICK